MLVCYSLYTESSKIGWIFHSIQHHLFTSFIYFFDNGKYCQITKDYIQIGVVLSTISIGSEQTTPILLKKFDIGER